MVGHRPERWRRIADDRLDVVLQPIISVPSGELVAVEALTRFRGSGVPTEQTFAVAYASGRGAELEAACLRGALIARERVPDGVLLTLNVSPDALLHPAVQGVLNIDLDGIVVEITEQPALDSNAMNAAVVELRARGALIAIDDATAGYAGLRRLAAIRPDIVKLDGSLVTGARDRIEQIAVIDALVSLSRRLDSLVLGEGVESLDDLAMLADLSVDYAQGRAIAPPSARVEEIPADVVETCRAARRSLLRAGKPLGLAPHRDALHQLTTALAGSDDPQDINVALRAAAHNLGVDQIGLSVLAEPRTLRELRSTATVESVGFMLTDYPATDLALRTGALVEAHVDDPDSDPAERTLLGRYGYASMLLVPLLSDRGPLGVLEFFQRTPRRWGAEDITLARLLADHVAPALARLGVNATS